MPRAREYLVVTPDDALAERIAHAIRAVDPNGTMAHATSYKAGPHPCEGAAIIDVMLPHSFSNGEQAQPQPYGMNLMLELRKHDVPVLLVLPAWDYSGATDVNDWIFRIANDVGASTIGRPVDEQLLLTALRVLERRIAFAEIS